NPSFPVLFIIFRMLFSFSRKKRPQLFKMDWVMLSIVLLCFIAALLYEILNLLEKYFSRQKKYF
ncbi:MAG: hypothetical protein MR867_07800, partial [Eubacterium sp.]|nr:hypothetical protein [Eubacterium sp.]